MIVVGLGNPGARYALTRHNAGFMVVDAVALALNVRLVRVWLRGYLLGACSQDGSVHHLAKPLTYMNRSGEVLPDLFRRTRGGPGDLLVVFDNVDLPSGACRLRLRGSGGGHRGLESIRAALGNGEHMRLSVGIGRPAGGGGLAEYVLKEPSAAEAAALRDGVSRAAQAVIDLLSGDPAQVMNELNRRYGPADP